MSESTPAKRYPKGSREQVAPDFEAWEFDCTCSDCTHTLIHPDLASRLQTLRQLLKHPIFITSGYRCDRKQKRLRERGFETSVGRSTHQDGIAADIATGQHSGLELEAAARKSGFQAVGVGAKWAHVDTRGGKDRHWEYHRRIS